MDLEGECLAHEIHAKGSRVLVYGSVGKRIGGVMGRADGKLWEMGRAVAQQNGAAEQAGWWIVGG